ncbi:MAG: MBL fold metallo-hydrolase [Saprospiraceae bacterium]|nr:MBL fold metallo-hydrolase [Saprospiraceae bacterium]
MILENSLSVKFLGTGTSQGVPVIGCQCVTCLSTDPQDHRLRTSALVKYGNLHLLIDAGPDLRQQLLKNKVDRVDAVLITHEHADHTAGLDDLRPLYFLNKKPIQLYAQQRVVEDLKVRFNYIFGKNDYPGIPKIDLNVIVPGVEFKIQNRSIHPLLVHHGSLEILGFRFGSLAYLTDVKSLTDEVIQSIKNIDCLVLNALHHEAHHSHVNLEQALNLILQIKPKRTYLVHLSHNMGRMVNLRETLPANVFVAFDNLEVFI